MLGLASYVMRGWWQAALVALGFAQAFVLVPLLFPALWVSVAAVALVTLRVGEGNGLKVTTTATLGLALSLAVIYPQALYSALLVMALWIMATGVSALLRTTVSLSMALLSIGVGGMVVMVLIALVVPDHASLWREWFEANRGALDQATGDANGSNLDAVLDASSPMMTLAMVTMVQVSLVVSLLTARWWQSMLFHPGGFGREFEGIRLGAVSAGVVAALLVAGMLVPWPVLGDLGRVGAVVFAVQGLSVFHGFVARKGMRSWMLAVYVLIVVMAPQFAVAVGLIDNWLNMRRWVHPRR
ncbi:MAG: hypothetical protein ACPGU7_08280 [Gammaproteobacteria bacterium]